MLAGASGFLGSVLRTRLSDDGHGLTQLVRAEAGPGQLRWDPYSGDLDPTVVDGADVVVNLAGVPIAHWPWTDSYKRQLLESRVATTTLLAETIAGVDAKPTLVNGSAIGYYGDAGDAECDEDSPAGDGFFADLVVRWEAATQAAAAAGARVVRLRSAIVLDKSGGALKLLKLPFLLGVGGRVGSGEQYFSTISRADWLEAVVRLMTDDSLGGAFNLSAPQPATNAEFTKAMGRAVHRPTVLPVPAAAVKLAAGTLSGEVLGSIRVVPRRLEQAGFVFQHPTVDEQLRAAFASSH